MKKCYLPFFPLKLVAFPGENVNLHIFEPRYRQLINECLDENTTFGIPVFGETMLKFGSEMEISRVVKRYTTGELDIVTRCVGSFRVLSFDDKVKGKLYAGGNVERLDFIDDHNRAQWSHLKHLGKELMTLLKMEQKLDVNLLTNSFELAHKLGLSLVQEYEMLQMVRESQRQTYMINHLERAIPLVRHMENTKERIKMNGHFQYHDPLNF